MLTAAIVTTAPSTVSADQIALTFVEHDLTISGEFIAYENDAFTLATGNGEVIVPALMVTCEGHDCPLDSPVVVTGS